MKMKSISLSGLFAGILLSSLAFNAAHARITESFDADWHFFKGDPAGAAQPQFDDHDWRQLDVPNDWSIAGPFCETNAAGGAGAFLPSGVAWYRKGFTLPERDSD